MKENEIRRHDRQAVVGTLRLNWRTEEGHSFSRTAKILDISSGGARVRVDHDIPKYSIVQVESKQFHMAGMATVRQCTREAMDYVVGLQFEGGLTWKKPEEE